jgi:hypothetical protein
VATEPELDPLAGRGGAPIRFAIRRPVTITVFVTVVVLFGILSVRELPIQLTPDVSPGWEAPVLRGSGASNERCRSVATCVTFGREDACSVSSTRCSCFRAHSYHERS